MTIILETDIYDMKLFRKHLKSDTILMRDIDRLSDFVVLNHKSIDTVLIDPTRNPFKASIVAQCLHRLFPAIHIIEYCGDQHYGELPGYEYYMKKPFDKKDLELIEELSG